MNKERVNELLKKCDLMFLSTSVDDEPRVRCMALIFHENKVWACTKSDRGKVRELIENDKIEICTLVKGESDTGSIRASGRAEIIHDIRIKEELSQVIPFFSAYWKTAADDDFTLIKFNIEHYILHDPDDKKFYEFSEKFT